MAHVLKYKDDDNLSLSPTENLAREGKLLERARPYAVAVIGWIFAVNEENRQSCCVGLVLERGNPLDTRIDFDSGLPVDEKMEKEDKEEWQMKGTPMYESPNRYHGTHTYKAPVVEMDDLYALTLMVYQIYVPGNPSDFEVSGGMSGPNPILEKRGFPDLSKVGSKGVQAWMRKIFVKGG
ncbi:hypothetical protein TWF106_008145 [Orbilia oligospora]|uniref:Uncharacterized protein n=1 Tax=Orbilia oligospora TaxID=2813651 RepID=A0A6G1MIA5_ORBOL|nr:hypothetical protein TWF106_008145 [Orbilia oligospora]KAF3225977.1 hypothetical protein TWF191_005003 [Orbilia oligospora]KAF3259696.1 hypothetical protein TWF192_010551 [Orbilia oligospora]